MKSGDRYAILSNDAKSAGRSKSVRPELKLSEAERVLRSFVARGTLQPSSSIFEAKPFVLTPFSNTRMAHCNFSQGWQRN